MGLVQVLLELRGLVGHVLIQLVDGAVGVDELGRGLLPHPVHSGQVVGGVASQGGVGHVVRRLHPGALLNAGLVVEGVVGHPPLVVEHPNVGVFHQLVGIPVAGDHDHVLAPVAGLGGQRCDHIVGLHPGVVHRGDPQRVHKLADNSHLLAQRFGSLLAVGLVARLPLVAEGRLAPVEGHPYTVGTVVSQEGQQHPGEAVHRVGHLSAGGRHVFGHGEKRPIDQRVPVHQHDGARILARSAPLSHRRGSRSRLSAGRRPSRRSRRPPRPWDGARSWPGAGCGCRRRTPTWRPRP